VCACCDFCAVETGAQTKRAKKRERRERKIERESGCVWTQTGQTHKERPALAGERSTGGLAGGDIERD
jgi:hypothetical protein